MPVADVEAVLRGASTCDLEALVTALLGEPHEQVLRDLLVVCCRGHVGADFPKHDGKYAVSCLEDLERIGLTSAGIRELADMVRTEAVAAVQREAAKRVDFDR